MDSIVTLPVRNKINDNTRKSILRMSYILRMIAVVKMAASLTLTVIIGLYLEVIQVHCMCLNYLVTLKFLFYRFPNLANGLSSCLSEARSAKQNHKLLFVAQGCIYGRSGGGLPTFQSYRNGDSRIKLHQQAIIPSYKFDCDQILCGNITEWGLDVHPAGNANQPGFEPYTVTVDFQVWRSSPTVDDFTGTGCYSLVGNNRFTSISLDDGVAIVTPSPQDYTQFQPGDVLGFYVEDARDVNDGVVVLTSGSFASELVWFTWQH